MKFCVLQFAWQLDKCGIGGMLQKESLESWSPNELIEASWRRCQHRILGIFSNGLGNERLKLQPSNRQRLVQIINSLDIIFLLLLVNQPSINNTIFGSNQKFFRSNLSRVLIDEEKSNV